MAKKFRILSIDGGGLRGIIPVMVLQELEKRTGKRIHELFDLIAGTSTGGLIACAITMTDDKRTAKYKLDDVLKIYTDRGKEIFPHKTGIAKFFNTIASLVNPEFSASGLEKVLKDVVGTKRISDGLKPIFITTYDLNNNEAVFFKTRHAIINETENALLHDVCRATSAGPTFLPAYKCDFDGKERLFIDGGVYMNNPAVGAIVEASKYHDKAPYNRPDMVFEDICVLSLSTGHYTADVATKIKKGGLINWAQPISDIMMQGVNQTTTYQADELLEDKQFLRMQLEIDAEKHANMANSSDETRDYIINAAQTQIINNAATMKQLDDFIKMAELV